MEVPVAILSNDGSPSANNATPPLTQDGSSGDDATKRNPQQRSRRIGGRIAAIATSLPLGEADSRSLSGSRLESQRDDDAPSSSATLSSTTPSTTTGSTLGNAVSSDTTPRGLSATLTTDTSTEAEEVAPWAVAAAQVSTAAQTEDTAQRNATANITAVDAATQTDETTAQQSLVPRVDASTENDTEPPTETKQPDSLRLDDAQASPPSLLRIDTMLDSIVDVAPAESREDDLSS